MSPSSDDPSDAGQLARVRAEEERTRDLVDAGQLADALDLVEVAIAQVHPRSLPALQERLARAAARARARMEKRR